MKSILPILALVLFLVCSLTADSQVALRGVVPSVQSGIIYLIPSSSNFSDNKLEIDSTKIINGSFNFRIRLASKTPMPYRFFVSSNKVASETGMFLIDSAAHTYTIDSLSPYISPKYHSSKIQSEVSLLYEPHFTEIIRKGIMLNERIDKIYEVYPSPPADSISLISNLSARLSREGDSLLTLYCFAHPNSYVSFWKLIERFEQWGYREEYRKSYNLLDTTIKKSRVGKIFADMIDNAGYMAEGKQFPNLRLTPLGLRDKTGLEFDTSKSYTLINFWFNSCAPCLKKLPKLNELYAKYSEFGFQILNISIDNERDTASLTKTIRSHYIDWPQLIDLNGVNANRFFIKNFPTTFLLNNRGIILKKNIDFESLENLLVDMKTRQMYFDTFDLNPR